MACLCGGCGRAKPLTSCPRSKRERGNIGERGEGRVREGERGRGRERKKKEKKERGERKKERREE